ncbi:MAG: response regulator [Planctomycetota bacterium]|nr:response regulator [Planctomycetota bacterium]
MLVDDNPTNLQVLSQSLDGQGLALLIARSGEEALEIAAKARPALILLDINMPGIGGFETCRCLKADPKTSDAIVIFLSARRDVEDKVLGLELGAADYISKPFDVDEVLARVRTHLRSYRKHQELTARNRELAIRAGQGFRGVDSDQLLAMIKAGESDRFELKSTLRWNLKADRAGKEIENAWLKTIVAFLNTDGGILVIGVADDGTVLGIELDHFPDGDRYLLHTNNLIRSAIGAEITPFTKFALKPLNDKEVLVVECLPAPEPVFLKRDGDEQFYIRIGPGSRKLLASEILAYVQSKSAVGADSGLPPEPSGQVPEQRRGERILLVDDNTSNLHVLNQTLEGRGDELLVACSGEEALKIAGQAAPTLILLDIMMPPGIDGYETCRRLKISDATRDIPVIFMSALDDTEDKVHGFEAGAVDYITKPFQAEEVIARVDIHLTIRRLHRQVQEKHDELEHELETVANVQRSLLPKKLPEILGLKLATYYEPSRFAGGDYYDIIELPENRWGILIADVAGHGTPAAVLMAMTYTMLHDYPDTADDPARVLRYLNQKLCPVCDGRFVTALYVVYDTAQRTIQYFSAGHMPPLIYRPAIGEFLDLKAALMYPLGIMDWDDIENGERELMSGDIMVLHTDGIIERRNSRNDMFGIERLCAQIQANKQTDPQQIVNAIVSDNDRFAGGLAAEDDRTLLVGAVKQ